MAQIAEPIPDRSDAHKAARNVALRYSGHEAAMLGEAIRAKRKAEKIQKFAATGKIEDLDFSPEEEAAMAVSLGNEYHTHITIPDPKAAEVVKPDVVKPDIVKPDIVNPVIAPVVNGRSRLLPIALLLACLGLGGIGAGLLAIWDRIADNPPAPTAGADTDTDTLVEVDFPSA